MQRRVQFILMEEEFVLKELWHYQFSEKEIAELSEASSHSA